MHRLSPSDYARVLPRLATIPFNTNFAEVVIRGDVTGSVFVDDPATPRVFLIAHPCGMSLLTGDPHSAEFEAVLLDYMEDRPGSRARPELLQAHPEPWSERIRSLLCERLVNGAATAASTTGANGPTPLPHDAVIEWIRLNYRFRRDLFDSRPVRPLPEGYRIARLGAESYDGWPGALMPPRSFWDTAADFERRGTAWAVMQDNAIASLAYSAFVFSDRLEIGIETHADHQGRGLATHACGAFIGDCLARGLEPVWSCRQGNLGSERTARAVGFEETRRIPYFALVHRKHA